LRETTHFEFRVSRNRTFRISSVGHYTPYPRTLRHETLSESVSCRLEMKQYLLPLKKSGVTVEGLVAEARAGGPTGAEAGESAVRQALKAVGVKKIGHREKIVQAVLAKAAAAADSDGS
jgi:hypothetical protein